MHPAAEKDVEVASTTEEPNGWNLMLFAAVLPMPPDARCSLGFKINLRICDCAKAITGYAVLCAKVCMYEVKLSMH
jgi:hypothetical protein